MLAQEARKLQIVSPGYTESPSLELKDPRMQLSATELLENWIRIKRPETILLSAVNTEESLIDENHARSLGNNMTESTADQEEPRGQLMPIGVRARLNENKNVVYDIFDGFHRTAAKKSLYDPSNPETHTIDAMVVYACKDEELFDLRILAASSVRAVQFPRIVKWITDSFESSEWSNLGLSPVQAFALADGDRTRVNNVKLTGDQITRLKTWAKDKAKIWQRSFASIRSMLNLAADADPDLVSRVRVAEGGHTVDATLTQAKLRTVVESFPGEQYHAVQRAILNLALSTRMKPADLEKLVTALKDIVKPGMTEEDVSDLAGTIELQKQEIVDLPQPPIHQKNEELDLSELFKLEDAPVPPGEWDIIEGPSDDELDQIANEFGEEGFNPEELIKLTLEVESDDAVAYNGVHRSTNGHSGKVSPGRFGHGDETDVTSLKKRVKDLEQVLEEKNHTTSSGNDEGWWKTAIYLSPQERGAMKVFMGEGDLEKYCEENHLTLNRYEAYVRSAINRKRIVTSSSTPFDNS